MRKVQSRRSIDKIHESELALSLLKTIDELNNTIKEQTTTIKEQSSTIKELQAVIEELKAKLNENSSNSNFPPSRDLYPPVKKDRSLRPKTGKKVGGQPNHPGKTRLLEENPDEVHDIPVKKCSCGYDFHDSLPSIIERHQVFEIPIAPYKVIEYRGEIKTCPDCGKIIKSTFPNDAKFQINFGTNLKTLVIYLKTIFIGAFDKISTFLYDMYHLSISPATIEKILNDAGNSLASFEEEVKEALSNEPLVHFDETGFRVIGERWWVHTASTKNLTILQPNPIRGAVAMVENGILPNFSGIAVHDYWNGYKKFVCDHVFCKAHIIRELRSVYENYSNQFWAIDMENLLWEAYDLVFIQGISGDPAIGDYYRISDRYDALIKVGLEINPPPDMISKNGRKKNSKRRNLLLRLKDSKSEVLSFILDPLIPFTNNLAERDLRPLKVQQKVSGTFRSIRGAVSYCRVASYLSTLRKNGRDLFESLKKLVMGEVIPLSHILGAE